MKYIGKLLTSPLLWGGLLSFGFYLPIHRGWVNDPFVLRYFASHPILYTITIMFLVGLASQLIKYFHVLHEQSILQHSPILEARSGQKVDLRYVDKFMITLERHVGKFGESGLSRRLRSALEFLKQGGSAEELDTELRHLAEDDAAKADADYGLVRLVLWAVPMVGFFGTVVGITMALGNLDLNKINESSKALSAGLAVAFDTTALAIALDLVLYFVQFLVFREESNLLAETDKKAERELRSRFETEIGGEGNDQLVAVRRMLESVVVSLEQMMGNQSAIWEQAMNGVGNRLHSLTEQNAEILKKSLAAAINENISLHAKTLVHAEAQLMERTEQSTRSFSDALRQNAAAIVSLQDGTVRQTEAIRNMLGTGSQLVQLEETLHQNLAAVAKVGNFEETINSLAAVIHLLNAKHVSMTETKRVA